MTATRMIRWLTVLGALALWLAAALWLWRTSVPSGLRLPHVDAGALLAPAELRRAARHERLLRWDWVAATLAQLAVLGALAWRPPRAPAAVLAAISLLAAWAVGLPFALLAVWWQNRYGLAKGGYAAVLDTTVLLGLALGALAAAALVAVAGRIGRRWWLVATPLLVAAATLLVLVSPLLTGGRSVGNGVYVEHVSDTTTEANAEAIGLGPTRRIVLWDTLLDGRFSPEEVAFAVAHERTHLHRDHVLKALAWFALFAAAGTFLISRLVRIEQRGAVPRALLLAFALQLVLLPLTNAISRRYELEADWGALRRTRDPAAGRALMRDFALTSLQQPNPPRWSYVLLDDHPTLAQRVGLADAWLSRRRAGQAAPGGS